MSKKSYRAEFSEDLKTELERIKNGKAGNHFPKIWRTGNRSNTEEKVDFEGSELANKLVEIAQARKLLYQRDSRLNQMGLMKDGGGLCGPTCASNVLMSLLLAKGTEINGKNHTTPQDLPKNMDVKAVKKILDWYNEALIDHYGRSDAKFTEALLISLIKPRLLDSKYGVLPPFFIKSIKDIYVQLGAHLIYKNLVFHGLSNFTGHRANNQAFRIPGVNSL